MTTALTVDEMPAQVTLGTLNDALRTLGIPLDNLVSVEIADGGIRVTHNRVLPSGGFYVGKRDEVARVVTDIGIDHDTEGTR